MNESKSAASTDGSTSQTIGWLSIVTVWRVAFWLLLLTTLYLSLIPAPQLPSAFSFWDKAQHATGFAALGFVGLRAYPGRLVLLLCGLALFGVGIEVAQWLTGWRFGDWQDWVADCAGLAIGWAAWRIRQGLTSSRMQRPPRD